MTDLVEVTTPNSGVATVTLSRPAKLNALSTELLAQLDAALKRIGDDRTVSAIVLTGADPAFSAGVDLDEIASGADFPAEPLARLHNSPVPVVAAINGAAVTGGLEMILACDLRIASDRARFADTHAKLGLTPAWGMPVTLPRAVGQAWARQISFTGAFIDAETALRIGLVNELVPHQQLLDRAVEIAAAIAHADRDAVRKVRGLYDLARERPDS